MSLANILKDPPPTHAFELSEEGISFAPVAGHRSAQFVPFEPGVLTASPVHENIQQPRVLIESLRALTPGNNRKRRAVLILPDYCARVAVLDFDTFPSDAAEQQALVRFRLKKSVPFEVETAALSYFQQPKVSNDKSAPKIEILAAVMSSEIVRQYEQPFLEAGFLPGLVTISSIAALNLLDSAGITLLVKLSGRVLSILVLRENAVKLARCIELEDGGIAEIEPVLHRTIAYVEDELGARPSAVWLAGFGAETGELASQWESEWGVPVQPIRSRLGSPDRNNSGLLGYLESVA